MGRPLLIIVTGLTVVFGIIQLGVWQRISLIDEDNSESAKEYDLRHHARSGLDEGIRKISHEENPAFPFELMVDGISIEVDVYDGTGMDLQPHQTRLDVRARGYGGKTYEMHAIVQRPQPIPETKGAVGLYGENNHLNIRGDVEISGYDQSGSGHDLPGIVGVSDEEDALSMSGNAYTIEGEPDEYVQDEEMNTSELDEYYERYMEMGQRFTDESTSFGTPDNPEIMIMEGENSFSGGTDTMGGVIVVPPGSKLELGGNFEFEGLILNLGQLEVRGNVDISGGIMFGDNSEADFEDADEHEMTGTSRISFDSSVINNLKEKIDISHPNEPKQMVALYE